MYVLNSLQEIVSFFAEIFLNNSYIFRLNDISGGKLYINFKHCYKSLCCAFFLSNIFVSSYAHAPVLMFLNFLDYMESCRAMTILSSLSMFFAVLFSIVAYFNDRIKLFTISIAAFLSGEIFPSLF